MAKADKKKSLLPVSMNKGKKKKKDKDKDMLRTTATMEEEHSNDSGGKKKKAPVKARGKASRNVPSIRTDEKQEKSGAAEPQSAPQMKKNKDKVAHGNPGATRAVAMTLHSSLYNTFEKFYEFCENTGVDGFRKIYNERLMTYLPPGDCTAWEANKDKNRYADIACLDASRVVLTLDVPPQSDYIHANWVKFGGHDRTFIATQAPMDNTIEDFWRMVFQESVGIIANLTKVVVDGKHRCAQYWPPQARGMNIYGKMTVNNKKLDIIKDGETTVYTLEVLPEGCSNSLIVKLIHFEGWSDLLPSSERSVLRLIKQISEADVLASGPVVVHCSAGVGRTGTVILIDLCLHTLFSHKVVDVDQLTAMFQTLRSARLSSIQKECHLVFMIFCVMEYINLRTEKKFDKQFQKFKKDYKSYITQYNTHDAI